MKYDKLILNIENDPVIERMFKAVVELIPQIPALDKLIKEATRKGPITVDFVTRAQEKTSGSFQQFGQICGNQKSIHRAIHVVKEGQSFAQMFEILIFELCNANNAKFELFGKDAIRVSDYLDSESYTLATEFAEYLETHVPAREILKSIFSDTKAVNAFQRKGLPLSPYEVKRFTADTFCSFNDWWQSANSVQPGRSYSHADIYRQEFDRKSKQHPIVNKQPLKYLQQKPQEKIHPTVKANPPKPMQRPETNKAIPITFRWNANKQSVYPRMRDCLVTICTGAAITGLVYANRYLQYR